MSDRFDSLEFYELLEVYRQTPVHHSQRLDAALEAIKDFTRSTPKQGEVEPRMRGSFIPGFTADQSVEFWAEHNASSPAQTESPTCPHCGGSGFVVAQFGNDFRKIVCRHLRSCESVANATSLGEKVKEAFRCGRALKGDFSNIDRLVALGTTGNPAWPEMHSATEDLVRRFSWALADKLSAAEKKYGYTDGWRSPDWIDECRQHLMEHVAKGDPRDVAAYCAFLWHHGASTAATSVEPAPEPVACVSNSNDMEGMVQWATKRIPVGTMLYASPPLQQVEPGWVMVPVEPTPEMVSRAMKECSGIGGGSCGERAAVDGDDMRSVWEAMLSAVPKDGVDKK